MIIGSILKKRNKNILSIENIFAKRLGGFLSRLMKNLGLGLLANW